MSQLEKNEIVRDLDFSGKSKFKMDFDGGEFQNDVGEIIPFDPSISITDASGYKIKLTGLQTKVLTRVLNDSEIAEKVNEWAGAEFSELKSLLDE